ncbi:hypothetical protein [Mucisphaera calidilacus]|uniref:hypothetical protein n=1 Tax=Mucisphaera calidilacus TaxID=2527982 RepID=UPI001F44F95E|nr:hypothetical protein [Mucisphaera calidilacus]
MSARRSTHPSWYLVAGVVSLGVWMVWSDSDTRSWPADAQALPNPAEQRLELIREVRALREAVERIERDLGGSEKTDRSEGEHARLR